MVAQDAGAAQAVQVTMNDSYFHQSNFVLCATICHLALYTQEFLLSLQKSVQPEEMQKFALILRQYRTDVRVLASNDSLILSILIGPFCAIACL